MENHADLPALHRRELSKFDGMSPRQVFSSIYEKSLWGQSPDPARRYFSGSGSHDDAIVTGYAAAVGAFLGELPSRPAVVDLGCGDFNVGARLVPHCRSYLGCDVVEALIAENAQRHAGERVAFQVIDMVDDELPPGDVVFLRQVLQHLSNAQIAKILPKVFSTYRHLVLTEHLPASAAFQPNLDKPTGCDIRLSIGSGIVITEAPFSARPVDMRVLCEFHEAGGDPIAPGVIRTIAYTLR